jgi:hypothetical protein
MTELLKKLSLLLLAPPICLLLYELVYNWFVKATFELGKLKFWWNKVSPTTMEPAKHIMAQISSSAAVEKLFNMPASIVLFFPPLFFWLLYRFIFLIQGGKTGGYKSRH